MKQIIKSTIDLYHTPHTLFLQILMNANILILKIRYQFQCAYFEVQGRHQEEIRQQKMYQPKYKIRNDKR